MPVKHKVDECGLGMDLQYRLPQHRPKGTILDVSPIMDNCIWHLLFSYLLALGSLGIWI